MNAITNDWRAKAANQTRLAFGQALLELGAREPRTVELSADTQDLLGIRTYIERYPERFIELGIAEQNTVGVASGLATTGLRPSTSFTASDPACGRCTPFCPATSAASGSRPRRNFPPAPAV